ncbi:MAG: hypothetical protein NTV43_03685 [Methylococcales bacterium]|nr:hypothetical protein [Methylococcales bacterium]
MDSSNKETGYILFGYEKGFSYYKQSGCALDFEKSTASSNSLKKAIILDLDSLGTFDTLHSYVHLVEHNNQYTIFIYYFGSKDFFGRRAYKGCALVLKNSNLNSDEIINNFSILSQELKTIDNNYTNDIKFVAESLSQLSMNLIEDGIIKTTKFIISTDLYKFFNTANKVNFYKVFVTDIDIFMNNYAAKLDDNFLVNPQDYFKKEDKIYQEIESIQIADEIKFNKNGNYNNLKFEQKKTGLTQEQMSLAQEQLRLAQEQLSLAQEQRKAAQNQIRLAQKQIRLAKERMGFSQEQTSIHEEKNISILNNILNISTEQIQFILLVLIDTFALIALLLALLRCF